jgi:hypothetical protein
MSSVDPAVYHDVFETIRQWPPEARRDLISPVGGLVWAGTAAGPDGRSGPAGSGPGGLAGRDRSRARNN